MGFNLSRVKSVFGLKQINFLGHTISMAYNRRGYSDGDQQHGDVTRLEKDMKAVLGNLIITDVLSHTWWKIWYHSTNFRKRGARISIHRL